MVLERPPDVSRPRGPFQVPFYYPYSNGAAYQQSAFFTGLLAAPLLAAGTEPVLAVNLLLLAELTASGALAYLLARAITGRVVPSLMAGALFAFYPNRMDHLGQFTYQQAVLFPLVFWAAYRFVMEGAARHLWLAMAALWAQMLSSLYNGYALSVLLAGLVVGLLVLRPARLSWSLAGRAATALAVLGLALAPFLWPYLTVHRELGFERTLTEGDVFGMDLLSILDPAEWSRFYRHRLLSMNRPEGGMFPGFVALALAGAAIVLYGRAPDRPALPAGARRARWLLAGLALTALGTIGLALAIGRARPSISLLRPFRVRDLTLAVNALPVLALGGLALAGRRRLRGALSPREWTLVLLFLALLTYLLCLAPTLLVNGQAWGVTLFRWVYLYLPGGGAFRAPGRWSLVFVLPLALLVGLGARAVTERLPRPWSRLVPVVLLTILLAELSLVSLPWHRYQTTPAVYDWLRSEPGDFAILQLPIHEKGADAWAMLWAIHHGKRVVNGHGGFALPDWVDLVTAADARDPDRLATAIRTIYPVRYVVVHPGLGLGRTWRPMWELDARGPCAGAVARSDLRARRRGVRGDPDARDGCRGPPPLLVGLRPAPSTGHVRHPPGGRRPRGPPPGGCPVQRSAAGDRRRAHPRPRDAPPPFPGADRNELVFHHVYDVPTNLTRTAPYRIGQTGRPAPVDLDVRSPGTTGGGFASVRVNGHELIGARARGYWLAALDPTDGRVLGARAFEDSERLAAFIEAWPAGTIVVAVAMGDLASQLSERAVSALRSVGGRVDLRGTSGWSHALVGTRGANPGEALEEGGPRAARIVIGKDRPLGITLEAFDLL